MPYFALIALALVTSTARAQAAPERATDQSRVMVGGALAGYWSNEADSSHRYRDADWAIEIAPSITYFVRPRVGVGVYGGYGLKRYSRVPEWGGAAAQSELEQQQMSAGLQLAGELPLGTRVGLFAWGAFGYVRTTTKETVRAIEGGLGPRSDFAQQGVPFRTDHLESQRHGLRASLFLPLAFHASSSVVLGLGPVIRWIGYVGNDDERFQSWRIGASSWIGASF